MKRTLLVVDDSPLVLSRIQEACGGDWQVAEPGASVVPDAVVVDPAWSGYGGLGFLHALKRRCGDAPLPVSALLRGANPPVQAFLAHLGIPFTLKSHLVPATLLGRLEGLQERQDSENWREVVRAWTEGTLETAFADRLLIHGILGLSGCSEPFEARRRAEAFLGGHFFLSEEEARASLNGVFPDRLQDQRVRDLYRLALDLIRPFLEALDEAQRVRIEGERIHKVFSRFLPSEVIEDLMRRQGDAALLRGEKRRIVALFSHIRDFGFYLEHNEPSVLVEFLNRHFQLYSDIIRRHGGSINKYIGDAVFALFGAPVSHVDNAQRALDAALEICGALESLVHPGVIHPPGGYRIGIGLNEGPAIVGNIGSTSSFDYTAIGDAVNLAARLESLNKHYKTRILLSQDFSEALNLDPGRWILRTVDRAKVKGKKNATTFFTVEEAPRTAEERAFLDAYEKGLKMERIGNWMTEGELLDRALRGRSEDELSRIHRARAAKYEAQPPSDWDGAEELVFK